VCKDEYNSTVTLKKIKTSKSQFNLFITEEKDIENDPYNDIKKLKKPTQNILLKELGFNKNCLPVLLKELVINRIFLIKNLSHSQFIKGYQLIMTFYLFSILEGQGGKIRKGGKNLTGYYYWALGIYIRKDFHLRNLEGNKVGNFVRDYPFWITGPGKKGKVNY